MNRIGRLIFLVTLIFINCCRTFAFQGGLYPIKNYTNKDYKELPQNWAIVQDNRGLMYFGNNAGVLEFDGVRWRTIKVPNETIVRSLALDSLNNTIYVGAIGEIGYLEADPSGSLVYRSLIDKVKPIDRDFGDVWRIVVLNDKSVFFQTSEKMFHWNGEIVSIIKPKRSFHLLLEAKGQLFVRDDEIGLFKWEGSSFKLIPGTESFSNDRIYVMIPYDSTRFLFNSRNRGLFLLELPSIEFPLAKISKFETDCEQLLVDGLVYNGLTLSDSLFSFGTLNEGLLLINKHGQLVNKMDLKVDLLDETVFYQYLDEESNLWLALSKGISKVDILSPIIHYNNVTGIEGSVKAITKYQKTVFVATSRGVFAYKENKGFEKLVGLDTEFWDLEVSMVSGEPKLFVASNLGVFTIGRDREFKLIDNNVAYALCRSESDPSIVYVGQEDGLLILKNGNEFLRSEGKVKDIINIVEEDNTHVWLGTSNNGIYELAFEDGNFVSTLYNGNNKLVDGPAWPVKFKGKILIGTDKGLYEAVRTKREVNFKLFRGDEFFTGSLIGIHRAFNFNKRLWLSIYSNAKSESEIVGYMEEMSDGKLYWEETAFRKLPRNIAHCIYSEETGITWIGRPDGLFKYDGSDVLNSKVEFNTFIRSVVIGKDSLLYGGAGEVLSASSFTLPYKLNSLNFEYASNSYSDEVKTVYSFKLEGYDEFWNDWTPETKNKYTNLYEGDYRFLVKARNVYGKQSTVAEIAFTILPPWYRTWWAYLSYVVTLILLVWGTVAWSTKSLRRVIADRTAEIRLQKEELDVKNRDITDSINYAQRLQSAILPNLEELKKSFSDCFIFYKPRDIVSGDFYWYAQKDNITLIAAIDCTGHGVPGAFLSVVANSSLNEVVNEKGIVKPAEILAALDEKIANTLKQDSEGSTSRDGMDMSLCAFDFSNNKLKYAGANRPLYLVRSGELKKFRGTKSPIGGSYQKAKDFEEIEIELVKGDSFYMFSDGYPDQFGGPKGKKFMVKQFGEMLLKGEGQSMDKQHKALALELEKWQGDQEPVDDVLVIGIKV